MNSEKDTLGKGRCKCLFRHEKEAILEGMTLLLQKNREDLKKEKDPNQTPLLESMEDINVNVFIKVTQIPLCIEEYKD